MVKGNIRIEMEAIMMESGREALKKEMECISTRMGIGIKESGNKILNMEKELITTQRLRKSIKEPGKTDISMEKEHSIIKMVQCTKVIGQMTRDTEKD